MQVLGVDAVLPIYHSLEEAVAGTRGDGSRIVGDGLTARCSGGRASRGAITSPARCRPAAGRLTPHAPPRGTGPNRPVALGARRPPAVTRG